MDNDVLVHLNEMESRISKLIIESRPNPPTPGTVFTILEWLRRLETEISDLKSRVAKLEGRAA